MATVAPGTLDDSIGGRLPRHSCLLAPVRRAVSHSCGPFAPLAFIFHQHPQPSPVRQRKQNEEAGTAGTAGGRRGEGAAGSEELPAVCPVRQGETREGGGQEKVRRPRHTMRKSTLVRRCSRGKACVRACACGVSVCLRAEACTRCLRACRAPALAPPPREREAYEGEAPNARVSKPTSVPKTLLLRIACKPSTDNHARAALSVCVSPFTMMMSGLSPTPFSSSPPPHPPPQKPSTREHPRT